MTQRILLVLTAALALFLATACGGDDEGDAGGTVAAPSAVPFDRAFIDGMVPHHEGAIQMARAAQRAGLSAPELVAIANDIIRTQQAEIDQMRNWRAEWFGSSEVDPRGAETLGLSEAEMGMQHAGTDFSDAMDVDQQFASMMIDHHRGAIRMAELGQEKGQHEEIRKLADGIIAAQEREIATMEVHAEGGHHG